VSHRIKPRVFLAVLLTAVFALGLPAHHLARAAAEDGVEALISGVPGDVSALYNSGDGHGIKCRNATSAELLTLANRDPYQELKVIPRVRTSSETGLTIVLRATPQLDNFPQAKAAFERAAATWESLVLTPMSVVVDVDFGPTWFGQPYEAPDLLGFTSPQMLKADPIFQTFKDRLTNTASNQKEYDLYSSLPNFVMPTDIGDTGIVVAPSAIWRAIGLINPAAFPEVEPPRYGPPPAVGINSNFAFDFDPTDGIDPDKYDFDAVATHELGHVLGFASWVGQNEMDPSQVLAVSVWDFFRLRPGSMTNFSDSSRILSSGGSQVYFFGGPEQELSTGRPDGTGGDNAPPSHWKDDAIIGLRIGIMDSSIPIGRRQTVTLNDVAALDSFGYRVREFTGNNRPSLTRLAADLNGDRLSIRGTAVDPDGDVIKAQARLLDGKDRVLGETAPFPVDIGIPTTVDFTIELAGMGGFPAAEQVSLIIIDTKGNQSRETTADFTGGDSGGPVVSSATYKNGKLIVRGKRFKDPLQTEINGEVIAPPLAVEASKKKLEVPASTTELNLQTGSNRVRVLSNGLRSNVLVINL